MFNTIQEILVDCQPINVFADTKKNCKNYSMTIGNRIKAAREAAGYTQEQLAKLLGVKQQSVHHWEAGNTQRPKKINEISSILGVSIEYLLNGESRQTETVDFAYPMAARCPLITSQDAMAWPDNKKRLKENGKINYPLGNIILKSNCFMLQLDDDSMENRMEGGGFCRSRYVIVDPERKYENGSYVVVKISGASKLLFRQYINDGKSEYVAPLNIYKYKSIDLTENDKICGVVVAYVDLLI